MLIYYAISEKDTTDPAFVFYWMRWDGAPCLKYFQDYGLEPDGSYYQPKMYITRLAQGLFGGQVHTSTRNMTHSETQMDHKSDQPHRWDLECIETGSDQYNTQSMKEFTMYLKYNPTTAKKRENQ